MGTMENCCRVPKNYIEKFAEKLKDSPSEQFDFNNNNNNSKKLEKFNKAFDFNKFLSSPPETTKSVDNLMNKINIDKLFYLYVKGDKISIKDDDFSFDNWKNYYPPEDNFFLFSKGNVSQNQILENMESPEKMEIYEGETNEEGKRHGYGMLKTPNFIQRGCWRNGKFTGWGKQYLRNGETYEGKFINGVLNGIGIFTNKDNKYVGEFSNWLKNGKGELFGKKYHYKGEFKDDKFHGKGVLEFLVEGNVYEGDFQNGEMKGKGIFKLKNGDIYEGEFDKNKFHGKGVYSYSNGKIYDGEYVNGIKNGHGKLSFPNGQVFEGNFNKGVLDGEVILEKDGKKTKYIFSEGNQIKKDSEQIN